MLHKKIKFIDLFAGLGGFRLVLEKIAKQKHIKTQCVFASEIDKKVIDTYNANFGFRQKMINIRDIDAHCSQVPDHDLLFAGFPCQCFSNAGKKWVFWIKLEGHYFLILQKY